MSDLSVGTKADNGKVRLDLIPPEVIFALGEILTFGANKYTINVLGAYWNTVNAKRISLYTPKENVVHVTKNPLGKIILSTQNVNERTLELGEEITLQESWNWQDVGKKIPNLDLVMPKQKDLFISESLDLQKIYTTDSFPMVVKYAEQQNICTLITTIQQENLEVFYAVSTTTVWDSLVTTLKVLKPHLDTSVLRPSSGERNWEKGMSWGRVYGALMRHLWAWWAGKRATKSFLFDDTDVETERSHLWHAACCIAFLLTYEERKIGQDDRQ